MGQQNMHLSLQQSLAQEAVARNTRAATYYDLVCLFDNQPGDKPLSERTVV